ncbi:MAG TPA: hypothetical protein VLH56_05930 [Dissulfurispiraceae bacterium]|nr:hypothetical protein [Dissulfurispiraceae bacterium]
MERLKADVTASVRERWTAMIFLEEIQREGFEGGNDGVRRYVQKWRRREQGSQTAAYIPQTFDHGEAFQFDWSHEIVELGGVWLSRSRWPTSVLPSLFTYQKHPELNIPNTTNSLDGLFAHLKDLLRVHRGLKKDLKNKIIADFLQN